MLFDEETGDGERGGMTGDVPYSGDMAVGRSMGDDGVSRGVSFVGRDFFGFVDGGDEGSMISKSPVSN